MCSAMSYWCGRRWVLRSIGAGDIAVDRVPGSVVVINCLNG